MIVKLFNALKKWDYRIKFLMVGGLNTAVGIGTYWLVLILFGLDITKNNTDVPLQIITATLTGQILGLINSYLWNKFFTFESRKKNESELVKFVSVYAVAFGMDYLLKFTLRKIEGVNEIIIAVATTVVTMIISFFGQKLFVFKYKKASNISASENSTDNIVDAESQNSSVEKASENNE